MEANQLKKTKTTFTLCPYTTTVCSNQRPLMMTTAQTMEG